MAYTIIVEHCALRDLKRLPDPIRTHIDARILTLAENPRPQGVEKLSGSD